MTTSTPQKGPAPWESSIRSVPRGWLIAEAVAELGSAVILWRWNGLREMSAIAAGSVCLILSMHPHTVIGGHKCGGVRLFALCHSPKPQRHLGRAFLNDKPAKCQTTSHPVPAPRPTTPRPGPLESKFLAAVGRVVPKERPTCGHGPVHP